LFVSKNVNSNRRHFPKYDALHKKIYDELMITFTRPLLRITLTSFSRFQAAVSQSSRAVENKVSISLIDFFRRWNYDVQKADISAALNTG